MITDRCALCPGTNACLAADGPVDAEGLFIGEAPGGEENKRGRVFIGKTGEEVNRHYLPLAGLRREGVRITNAIRCLPTSAGGKLDSSRRADLALLDSCTHTGLYPLIEQTRPRYLVPLGAFACRAVFGEAFDLELKHGTPQETPWGIPAFPMYHPALGIYEPKKMLYLRTDWQRLRSWLSGRLLQPVDPYPNPDYREVEDAREIAELDPTQPLAGDTESQRGGEPFCLTYSQRGGTGRLIRASRVDLLQAFQTRLQDWESEILFHFWLYDWSVVEKMGLRFPLRHIVDTGSLIFHLGNLPQGLKAVAYRELGMVMQDFDDLVTSYSARNVLYYYNLLKTEDWPRPPEQVEQDSKTGLWKLYRPQSMNTKLKRFFTDYEKNPEKDVFKMWEDNWVDEHEMLESRMGPWPGKCISHVPFNEVLFYACRDSDALIRLRPVLRRMASMVRHFSQDKWRAA